MDFISFSLNYWEDLWQSRHQIMLELSTNHKVLFVSPPFSLDQVLADFWKNQLPKTGLIYRQRNLYTLVFPKWLCETYRFPRLTRFVASVRRRMVMRTTKKLGFRDTVLFIWHPRYADLTGTFGESVCCYYADDEFANYAGQQEHERQAVIRQEDELLKRADVVFANGPALLEVKNRYGNALSVPMTADFELFSRSRLAETPVPRDLEAIPHPRITYIGNINDKVDFDLLLQLSEARPKWSFVLVGPTNVRGASAKEQLSELRSRPNIFMLGGKPREELPSYIKGSDVCTMAYRNDGWAYYVYPLKLHEYLASGKPVVGAGLRSLKDFAAVVRIAESTEEWLRCLEDSLNENDPALVAKRIEVAYENRLERRIESIEQALQARLEARKGRTKAT
jgi:glycosyltransferase involved in cell wall biosynthesis